MHTVTNALSVDVEDCYHAAIFRKATRTGADPRCLESRVEDNVDRLLALMRDRDAKATFFILGEVAAEHPAVVRKIAADGHEVACHGDRHDDVSALTRAEFRADLRRAKARIEQVLGGAVIGYRAPNFSIGAAQSWAYDILLEEGFRYDSSVFPILHDRYGQATAPRFPYEIRCASSARLVEFPIGTIRLLGINLPIGGGGYFRLAPEKLFRMGIHRVNTREHQPVMFYLHPWEMDPGQPRQPMAWRHRFRLYVGLETHAAKLALLLTQFRFGTARDVLQPLLQSALEPRPVWPPTPRTDGTPIVASRAPSVETDAWRQRYRIQ